MAKSGSKPGNKVGSPKQIIKKGRSSSSLPEFRNAGTKPDSVASLASQINPPPKKEK